jgi:hypothetical protein
MYIYIYIYMCIYSYKFVCASAYISRTRRRAGSLKGFPGFAFSRRICAIAITCRIRAGHRVSATPISAIRVRLRSRFSTRTRFTFAIRDHNPQHDSHSRSTSAIAFSHSRILAIPSSQSAFALTISIAIAILRGGTRGYVREGTRTKKTPEFLLSSFHIIEGKWY